MSRGLDTAFTNLIKRPTVRPAFFIFADFPSGARRVWTGIGDQVFLGETWEGIGDVLSLDSVSESTDSGAQGMSFNLNPLDIDLINTLIGDDYQGRVLELYMAFWDDARTTLYAPQTQEVSESAPTYEEDHADTTDYMSRVSSAGGSEGPMQRVISNAFFTYFAGKSYRNKIKYILPVLGKNIQSVMVPWWDPDGAGNATNTGFVDADFSEITGLQGNGSSKRITIPRTPAELGTSNNGGVGYWELNSSAGTQTTTYALAMGADGSQIYGISLIDPNRRIRWGASANAAVEAIGDGAAHYYGQRASAVLRELFVDGTSRATNTTNDTASNAGTRDFFLMGRQEANAGGAPLYYAGRCGFAYLTDGTMTSEEISDFHSLVSTYVMTPLGRLSTLSSETTAFYASARAADALFRFTTITIAEDLVTELKTLAGYSKIKYLMPYLGRNLAAALTPLIDTDAHGRPTNHNFVEGDFVESASLHGTEGAGYTGSTPPAGAKYLAMPFNAGDLGAGDNGGVGFWALDVDLSAGTQYGMGTWSDFPSPHIYGLRFGNAGGDLVSSFYWGGPDGTHAQLNALRANNHYYGQRNATNSRQLFVDGVSAATNTTNSVAVGSTQRPMLSYAANTTLTDGVVAFWGGSKGVEYYTDGTLSDADVDGMHVILLNSLMLPTSRLDVLESVSRPIWGGMMDSDEVVHLPKGSSLTINCEHRLRDMLRKREWLYTHRDQELLYPGYGDEGLSRVDKIQDTTIPWGKKQK